jgi:hypothetical protein
METTTDSQVIVSHIHGVIDGVGNYNSTVESDYTPLFHSISSGFNITNGLLILIIVYIILRDIAKYINSWISGGMV